MALQAVRVAPGQAQEARVVVGARTGTLVSVDAAGRPWVSYEGVVQPVLARVCADTAFPQESSGAGTSVLLVFDGDDAARPVIVGFVRDTLAPQRPLRLDATQLRLDARDELVLHCGLGSLTISADGHVVLRGTRLVSRASETNKIRGATVLIN